MRLLISEK